MQIGYTQTMTSQNTIDAMTAWHDHQSPENLTRLVDCLETEPEPHKAREDTTNALVGITSN